MVEVVAVADDVVELDEIRRALEARDRARCAAPKPTRFLDVRIVFEQDHTGRVAYRMKCRAPASLTSEQITAMLELVVEERRL